MAAWSTQTPAQVQAAITDVQYSPYEPVPILRTAPTATVQYLQDHSNEYPGVTVQQVTERQYPQGGQTAAYVLGYVGAITGTELKAHPTRATPRRARSEDRGGEQYEPYLRGTPGTENLEVNAQGNVVGTASTTRPTQGDTLVLNLTVGLQSYAQQALTADMAADRQRLTTRPLPQGHRRGRWWSSNAETGAVLAMASVPHLLRSQHGWAGSRPPTTRSFGHLHPAPVGRLPAQQQRHPGPLHPGLDLQAGHGHRRPADDGIVGPTTY